MHLISSVYKSNLSALIWGAFKALILILFCWLLNERIIEYDYSEEIAHLFTTRLFEWGNSPYFIAAVVLMFVNWYLESYKWQQLCSGFRNLSVAEASHSILIGLSLGVVTPGRIGEYGGRMLAFNADQKALAIQSHILSSLSQNIVNLVIGIFGGAFFILNYTSFSSIIVACLSTIGLLFISLLVALYYNNEMWTRYILKYCPRRFQTYIQAMETQGNTDRRVLNHALFISFIRYIVFCTQYALLLYFFGIDVSIYAVYSGIALVYFVQSGIPLPPFLSMLARGEIAIVVWSLFSASIISILSATFTLWIVNLLIPAILGTILLLRMKRANNDIKTKA